MATKPQAPPRVANHYLHWTTPPPEESRRCAWWRARIAAGWRGNRRVPSALGYDSAAQYMGVYIWEWIEVLSPMLQAAAEGRYPPLETPALHVTLHLDLHQPPQLHHDAAWALEDAEAHEHLLRAVTAGPLWLLLTGGPPASSGVYLARLHAGRVVLTSLHREVIVLTRYCQPETPSSMRRQFVEALLRRAQDADSMACEECAAVVPGVAREPSRTAYWHAPGTPDPNQPIWLCRPCADEYHSYWTEMWEQARPTL